MSDIKVLENHSHIITQWLDGKIPDTDLIMRIKNYVEWRRTWQ